MMSKYTALAASYCLIRYVENAMGLMFADARYNHRSPVLSGAPAYYVPFASVSKLTLVAVS